MWACWLGIGILVYACAQGLIARWLGRVPANLALGSSLIQPDVTTTWDVIIVRQPLATWQVVGALVVMMGLFLAIRGQLGRSDRK